MGPDDPVLVEQGQAPFHLQHALDHEHHVRPTGVVLVEHERRRVLQRPGQEAFSERGDLLTVLDHDRVLAHQVDPADVAVEIDPDARPVEPRRHLLDVRGLAGAVVALDHHPAVVREPGQDRHRGVRVEPVVVVDIGHVLGARAERGHPHVLIEPELLPHTDRGVRQHVGRKRRVVDVHSRASWWCSGVLKDLREGNRPNASNRSVCATDSDRVLNQGT